MTVLDETCGGPAATRAFTTASPKRKRTDSTSIIAADTLFLPDLATSSRTSLSDDVAASPLHLQLPVRNLSIPPSSYFDRRHVPRQTPPREGQQRADVDEDAYPDSPRSVVTRKLQGLDLAVRNDLAMRPMPVLHFGEGTFFGRRKRLKLDAGSAGQEVNPSDNQDTHPSANFDPTGLRAGSPFKSTSSHQDHRTPSSTRPADISKAKFKRSKSPPLPSTSSDAHRPGSGINWWMDSEITGHLGLDPEDDGYGINGVGFRPTPAMLAARSAKRRRQVDEWRSRELREERRRRAEGRKGRRGSVDPGGGADGAAAAAAAGSSAGGPVKKSERMVRFA